MSNLSTFGAYTTARLGISAAQNGLNVTGNNITNINTLGYTRQRLDQASFITGGRDRYSSNLLIGSGVMCTGVSQIRDPYLDIRYRNETSNVGSADAKLRGLEELSRVIDEVAKGDGSGVLEAQFNDLVTQIQNLSANIGQDNYDSLVRSSAESLTHLFNSYASKLEIIKENQKEVLNQEIDTVNSILDSIRSLNDTIMKSEIHGNAALEMKDQRNLLLDELSEYMSITLKYEKVGVGAGEYLDKLIISLAGSDTILVDGEYGTQLLLRETSDNYDIDLTALMNVKGNILENSSYVELGDNDMYGSLQSIRELLTEAGEFSSDSTVNNIDRNAAGKKGIPYYQKALDALAKKLADLLNEANTGYLADASGNFVDENGLPIEYYDSSSGTYIILTRDMELTNNQREYLDSSGITMGGALFSNSATGDDNSGITASNITVSKSWSLGSVRIVGSMVMGTQVAPNSTDNSNILNILILMDGKQEYRAEAVVNDAYDGNQVYFKGSFQEMLSNIESTLAIDTKSTSTLLSNHITAAQDIYQSRNNVSNVDLNEEATNLMQYQQAYSAACRLMTTLDEALDKLINGTGIVGR